MVNKARSNDKTCLLSSGWKRALLLFSYSSMSERWLESPTRTCDLGVTLCAWLFPTAIDIWMLVDTNFQVACCFANVCLSTNTCALEMTCEGCMFYSFSSNIDSILRVCQMIKKLKFHFVHVFSFFMNLLLSTSFLLQNGNQIPILGLSSNQFLLLRSVTYLVWKTLFLAGSVHVWFTSLHV